METYDAIVVGSGHNALVTAAYLARAGRGVLLLERNDRPGGLVRTDELTLPGFKHDVYSAAHPLFLASAAYAELAGELGERGLRYLNTDTPTAVSFPDGRTAVLFRSLEETIADAERLAPGDGAALAGIVESFGPYTADVFRLFGLDLASPEATEIIARLTRGEGGSGLSPFVKTLFESARGVVAPFRSPVMAALLAPWVVHLGRTPDELGSGIWVVLVALALMGAGMPIPEGGSERLAQALVRLIEDRGGVVRTETAVSRILIDVGDGSWTHDLTERFAERAIAIVGKHIPNVPSAVIGHAVVTPDSLARFNPNLGPGDPYGGAHDLAQSYLLRPPPGQPSHRSAIPNLYTVGAATWPGHGINGGSGYIVAQQLLGQTS